MNAFTDSEKIDKEIAEAERALLSCIYFYYPEIESLVAVESVSKSIFVDDIAKRVFQALKESPRKHGRYDAIDVSISLKKLCVSAAELSRCESYLSNLSQNIYYYSISDYLSLLRAHHIKRSADGVANRILRTPLSVREIDSQVIKWQGQLSDALTMGTDVHSSTISQA